MKNKNILVLGLLVVAIFIFSGCIGQQKTEYACSNGSSCLSEITTTTEQTQESATTTLEKVQTTTTLTTTAIQKSTTTTILSETSGNIKVEVYHFHVAQQGYSCKTVGAFAEKTVNTYFKKELDSGRLVFGHINIELPENKELVEKYEVTSSSLWIGTYINGKFYKEQNTNVWYKINNEQDYLAYLKGILSKRLFGNLD